MKDQSFCRAEPFHQHLKCHHYAVKFYAIAFDLSAKHFYSSCLPEEMNFGEESEKFDELETILAAVGKDQL